jgi:hypothetical protein
VANVLPHWVDEFNRCLVCECLEERREGAEKTKGEQDDGRDQDRTPGGFGGVLQVGAERSPRSQFAQVGAYSTVKIQPGPRELPAKRALSGKR